VSRLSRQCGILNISQLNRCPWSVTGIALLYSYELLVAGVQEIKIYRTFASPPSSYESYTIKIIRTNLASAETAFKETMGCILGLQENKETAK
jgi:hypothetical protein